MGERPTGLPSALGWRHFVARCSMKFGPGGAARSVSASKAGREHAVAANAVSDVVGRCRCSPLSIANSNRCSFTRVSCYVVVGFIP